MGKNIDNNISKNLSSKYSQKLLDHAKISSADATKIASKKEKKKTAGAASDLIGNKIADKIMKLSSNSPQNSSKTVEIETEDTG